MISFEREYQIYIVYLLSLLVCICFLSCSPDTSLQIQVSNLQTENLCKKISLNIVF